MKNHCRSQTLEKHMDHEAFWPNNKNKIICNLSTRF